MRDNGPGIPKDRREDIFLPFYTTHKGGSGVGLSFSRQVALATADRSARWTRPKAARHPHGDLTLALAPVPGDDPVSPGSQAQVGRRSCQRKEESMSSSGSHSWQPRVHSRCRSDDGWPRTRWSAARRCIRQNIVDNAVNSKDHTTLVAAVKAAGLVDTLSARAIHRLRAHQRGVRQASRRNRRHTGQAREQGDARPRSSPIMSSRAGSRPQQIAAMAARHHGTATLKTVEGETLMFRKAARLVGDRRQGRQSADHDRQCHAVEWRDPCRRRGPDALNGLAAGVPWLARLGGRSGIGRRYIGSSSSAGSPFPPGATFMRAR